MSQQDEMRQELEDQFTDQALREVLGGRRPPDLTARILSAVRPVRRWRSRRRQLALAAAVLLLIGAAVGYVAYRRVEDPAPSRIAERPAPEQPKGIPVRAPTAEEPTVPADPNNAVPTNSSAPTRQEQLASLVDEFNSFMHEKRYAEAEVVYQRAAELAPDELVVRQLKNTVKLVRLSERYRSMRRAEGYVTALNNVESAAIPYDDDEPFRFEPSRGWERLTRTRKALSRTYPVADLTLPSAVDGPPVSYPDPEVWQMLAERRKKMGDAVMRVDVNKRLRTQVLLNHKDTPLKQVLDDLSKLAQLPMLLDLDSAVKEHVAEDTPVTIKLTSEISTKSALDLVLKPLHLDFRIDDGRLRIGSEQDCGPQTFVDEDHDRYARIIENPFLSATENPLSTFGVDVDTASYARVRRCLTQEGELPPADAVRIEELLNYFDYDYAPPNGELPFAPHVELATCPWQPEHRLLRIGLKGREVPPDERPATNLVFLLDVSGSMEPDDRLPRAVRAMRLLVDRLRENDRVAIVVYAGESGLVLPSTAGFQKERITSTLENLHADGSTNGASGIRLAYDTAQESFIKGGTNRVILCTDGDFNVGTTSTGELERLIEERAKGGVFLTVLGFGMGNHNDDLMEKLADKGNGNYGYVDSEAEARKLLVEQAGGTLVTIAKDVKVQIEFNPRLVAAYRLIGYEDRLLEPEDFNDDKKDAGEIGAGHAVTALYEIVPAGKNAELPKVDELKYQRPAEFTTAAASDELMTMKVKYKRPDAEKSEGALIVPVPDSSLTFDRASPDFRFAAAVAGLGLLLRDSQFKGDLTFDAVVEIAGQAIGADPQGRRAEFLELVRKAKTLDGRRAGDAPGNSPSSP